MEHSEGTFQGYDGMSLYYQRWRPAATPKAVLVVAHGFGEYSGRYGNVVDWFVPRGYAVYALDMRGYGHSPGARGHVDSFDEYRQDLIAFLTLTREAEPGRPIFLLGHSLGGLLALNYVLHDPSGLQGIVASGPTLGVLPLSPFLKLLSKTLSRVWPSFSLDIGLDTTALSRDPSVEEAYVNDPLVHNTGSVRLGTETEAAINWTQTHAADLALPCLIIHGGDDRLGMAEYSQRFFENVTFADKERIEYEGYYHEIFNDVGKEKVLADVEDWIERHLG